MTDQTYNVSADKLRQFIERAEQIGAEKRDLAETEKELIKTMKPAFNIMHNG